LYIAGRGSERRKNTLIHINLVSEEGILLRLCGDFSQVCSSQEDSQEDCRGNLESLSCRETTSFPRGKTDSRNNRKMDTKGHGCGGNKNHQQLRKVDMDKELTEIRARMEELAL
jgi:hypothetical protein